VFAKLSYFFLRLVALLGDCLDEVLSNSFDRTPALSFWAT
jgi:hypothetical protein